MRAGATLSVQKGSDTKFLVDRRWEVDLDVEAPSCSCMEHKHTGLPCVHMAAALQSVQSTTRLRDATGRAGRSTVTRELDIASYVDGIYSMSNLRAFYAPEVKPCAGWEEELTPDGITLPIDIKQRGGRPRKLRMKGASDIDLNKTGKCSRCGGKGHNSRTCERREREELKKARKKARYEANKHAHDYGDDDDDESVYEPTGWFYEMETGVGRSDPEEMVVAPSLVVAPLVVAPHPEEMVVAPLVVAPLCWESRYSLALI